MSKRTLDPGIYHIYNRGYNHQKLFYEDRDYEKFLRNLNKYNKEFSELSIASYCLIPNHFHFLIDSISLTSETDGKKKLISLFMHKLQGSYAMFFNAKYGESKKRTKTSCI